MSTSYSHEFKTPITAIKGFAELLSEPDLTEEERQQYLRIIQDESARLAELTNPDAAADKIAVPAVFAGSNHVFSG